MGGGDLNLKKSWHPGTQKNRERVAQVQRQALEEKKKEDQLRREREEEAAFERLEALNTTGKPKVDPRIRWMYEGGPSDAGAGNKPYEMTPEKEAYLLGKRRVDKLLEADGAVVVSGADAAASDKKDDFTPKLSESFLRQDPLFKMRQAEQAWLEKARKDTIAAQQLKGKENRHHADHSNRSDRHHRSEHRHSDRHRSHRYRESHRDDRRDSDRLDEPTSSRRAREGKARSQSPIRDSRHGSYHGDRYYDRKDHNYSRRRSRSPERSPEYHHKEDHEPRQEHRGHYRGDPRGHYREVSRGDYRDRSERYHDRSSFRAPRRSRRDSDAEQDDAKERERKLAEMQQDAANLAADRKQRVEQADRQDAEERAHDDKLRSGTGRFVSDLHKQKHGLDLGETMRREVKHRSSANW